MEHDHPTGLGSRFKPNSLLRYEKKLSKNKTEARKMKCTSQKKLSSKCF